MGNRRRAIRGYILICARIMNVLLHMISVVEKGIDSPEGILYDIEVACKNDFE